MIKIDKKFKIHFVKYVLVGGLNFVTSLTLLLILLRVIEMQYLIAITLTRIFGILLTYVINFVWVFKIEDKLAFKKRFFKYFSVYLVSYIINIFLLKFIVEQYNYDPLYIQFFLLPFIVVFNFTSVKYWALK